MSPGYYYPDFQFLSAEMENLNIPWENKQFPGFFGYGYIKTAAQVYQSNSPKFGNLQHGFSIENVHSKNDM